MELALSCDEEVDIEEQTNIQTNRQAISQMFVLSHLLPSRLIITQIEHGSAVV